MEYCRICQNCQFGCKRFVLPREYCGNFQAIPTKELIEDSNGVYEKEDTFGAPGSREA